MPAARLTPCLEKTIEQIASLLGFDGNAQSGTETLNKHEDPPADHGAHRLLGRRLEPHVRQYGVNAVVQLRKRVHQSAVQIEQNSLDQSHSLLQRRNGSLHSGDHVGITRRIARPENSGAGNKGVGTREGHFGNIGRLDAAIYFKKDISCTY